MRETQYVTEEELKGCPLCGNKVSMKVMGKIIPAGLRYDDDVAHPRFAVRAKIECKVEFLTLDLAQEGYTASDEQICLNALMREHERKIREIWNSRPKDA